MADANNSVTVTLTFDEVFLVASALHTESEKLMETAETVAATPQLVGTEFARLPDKLAHAGFQAFVLANTLKVKAREAGDTRYKMMEAPEAAGEQPGDGGTVIQPSVH